MEVNTQTWCLMSTETTRLNRDGEKGGEGGYQGGGGGRVEGEPTSCLTSTETVTRLNSDGEKGGGVYGGGRRCPSTNRSFSKPFTSLCELNGPLNISLLGNVLLR